MFSSLESKIGISIAIEAASAARGDVLWTKWHNLALIQSILLILQNSCKKFKFDENILWGRRSTCHYAPAGNKDLQESGSTTLFVRGKLNGSVTGGEVRREMFFRADHKFAGKAMQSCVLIPAN